MLFFAPVLRRLELFAKLEHTLPFIGRLGIENDRRWRFLCHRIMRYSRISRLQGGVETQYWRGFRVLRREREFS